MLDGMGWASFVTGGRICRMRQKVVHVLHCKQRVTFLVVASLVAVPEADWRKRAAKRRPNCNREAHSWADGQARRHW